MLGYEYNMAFTLAHFARESSTLDAEVPFLNIVQAATWSPVMRVPDAEEMRFLVYTTLAYGAQGISYYVYCWPKHTGGIANPDGTPTALYPVLKLLNRDFAIMAAELQPLKSLGVYHAGVFPPGAVAVPSDCAFQFDPPCRARSSRRRNPHAARCSEFSANRANASRPRTPSW